MFFDDPSTSRKKVSMRGSNSSNKLENKENFLEKTQQEREKRLLEKLRQKSATRLQAIWRGRVVRIKWKTRERKEFDQLIHHWESWQVLPTRTQQILLEKDVMEVESPRRLTNSSDSANSDSNQKLDAPSLRLLLRKILFFYAENTDEGRLDKIAEYLLENIRSFSKSSDAKFNMFFSESRTSAAHYATQMKKMLALSLKRLVSRLDIYLQLILFITSPDILILASDIPQEVRRTVHNKITSFAVEKGFFKLMKEVILQFAPIPPSALPNVDLMKLIISIAVRPLQFAQNASNIYKEFVENILVIPYLSQRLPSQVLPIFVSILPIVLGYDPKIKDKQVAMHLLGNLCSLGPALVKGLIGNSSLDSKNQTLLTNYIKFVSLMLRSNAEAIFEDESDKLLMEQIRILVEPNLLKNLFSVFMPVSLQNPVESVNNLSQGLVHVCNMYILLQSYWKSHQSSIINSLTYHTPIVKNLWTLISKTTELSELLRTGIATDSLLDFTTLLLLFAKCYSQLLMVLDDSEFFNSETYLKLSQHEYLVKVLKKIVFRFYWNPIKPRDVLLRDALTMLLQQLYDRNSRHSFCGEESWVEDSVLESDYESERMQAILTNIPFTIPFKKRLAIFYDIVDRDRDQNQNPLLAHRIRVRRDFVFEDAYSSLNHLNEKLKGTIRVEYISSSGLPEPGIDGGGMFKEFFGELIKTAYNTAYGLFKETSDRELYPNPNSNLIIPDSLPQFEFLGKILAKAIMEGILVELPFANFFLSKLLGKYNYVNDLVFLDSTLHKNLMSLKKYDNVEDLSLNFTVVDNELGTPIVKELIPGGKEIPITNENKLKYIGVMANYKLNVQIKEQSAAFLRGFSQIIAPDLIRMFNQDELQTIVSGNNGGIDIEDLKSSAVYSGGYSASHEVIQRFWRVLASLTPEEQRKFLMFVTSCSRPPLLGFSHLKPAFAIHRALPQGDPNHYLPTASTCMNFLKLPPYGADWIMKEKILYAINSKAGFELS